MHDTINFATIGRGMIVKHFLAAMAGIEQFHYIAAYSRSLDTARDFARRNGADKWYTDLTALAEDPEVDAVYIASPNACHCEQAILLMNHGIHILCEKPIASNSLELARMIVTAQKNRVVLMEGIRTAFTPGFAGMRDLLPKLGTLRQASFCYCQYSSRYDKFKVGIVENAFRPEFSNGALMDIGIYCVHPAAALFGRPDRVRADAVRLKSSIDGAGTILAYYADGPKAADFDAAGGAGLLAECVYSKITDSSLPSTIRGENAEMIIDKIYDIHRITLRYRDGRTEEYAFEPESSAFPDMKYECAEWLRRIKENVPTDPELLADSICTLQIMDDARQQTGIVYPADEM